MSLGPTFLLGIPGFQSATFRVEEDQEDNWKPNKKKWEYYTTGRGEAGTTVQSVEQGIPAYYELVI